MNTSQPTLETQRLILRSFHMQNANAVQRLAGEWNIARMTLTVPHPYEDGMAESWIATHVENFASNRIHNFAIVLRATQELCGCISLGFDKANNIAEIGYWIGVPFWNQGICSEAASIILDYGFSNCNLHKIYARHLGCNPASGCVMQKNGMTHEGVLREHILRYGERHDMVCYGILRSAWKLRNRVLE